MEDKRLIRFVNFFFVLGIIYLISEPISNAYIEVNKEWTQSNLIKYKQELKKLNQLVENLSCKNDSLISLNEDLIKENTELKKNIIYTDFFIYIFFTFIIFIIFYSLYKYMTKWQLLEL